MYFKNTVIVVPELLGKSWNTPEINWYPGHMLKAKKELAKQLKRVDVVLEMRDARIPVSSANHDFEELLQQKKRILLFNKTNLADEDSTRKWKAYFKKMDTPSLFVDAVNKQNLQEILPLSRKLMQEKWSNFRKRDIRPPSLKLLITGIPNVGKSSLINRLSRRKAAETGPTPGVTKHQDWIKLGKNVELLDRRARSFKTSYSAAGKHFEDMEKSIGKIGKDAKKIEDVDLVEETDTVTQGDDPDMLS